MILLKPSDYSITIFVQSEESKTELKAASKIGERYWMATYLLIFIVVACIGIIIHRQMELNNCLSSHTEFRNKIEVLVAQKGANEEKSKTALALKEQNNKILERLFSNEDRALKGAVNCEEHLREVEASTRQAFQNMTILATEKEAFQLKYLLCNDKLIACEATKTSQ